jgi:hypothetical protein
MSRLGLHSGLPERQVCCAGELPPGIEKAAFAWERGSKVYATELEPVNPHTRAVFWKQFLKQVDMQSFRMERAHSSASLYGRTDSASPRPSTPWVMSYHAHDLD